MINVTGAEQSRLPKYVGHTYICLHVLFSFGYQNLFSTWFASIINIELEEEYLMNA